MRPRHPSPRQPLIPFHEDTMPRTKNTTTPATSPSTATLTSRLHELISACHAAREITDLCRAEDWWLGVWNCDSGMQFPVEQIAIPGVTETQDPPAVIRAMRRQDKGQSESNVRAALKLADAMAPCVLFAGEIEKALAGATSSGQTDSGVTARVFGSLLTWLNDHESDVFFVATCNDASKLLPEFARAERFDGVFFLDLPGRGQKDATWGIYTGHYGLDAKQARPDDTNWTGAEIKSCCRLALLLDVPLVQAAQNVMPVAVTAGDNIEALRQWASGRCLSADRAGVYSRSKVASGGRVRRVVRGPMIN